MAELPASTRRRFRPNHLFSVNTILAIDIALSEYLCFVCRSHLEFLIMLRSRLKLLLFSMAIILQVMAPMAGNLAHANVFRQSGVSTIICETADGSHRPGKGSRSHHIVNKHCLLCSSLADSIGFTLVDGQLGLVSSKAWVISAFPAQLDTSPASRETQRYRARAPPTLCRAWAKSPLELS